MVDWLRLSLMLFYSPVDGMREVRDRASLAPAGFVALIALGAFFFSLTWFYLGDLVAPFRPAVIISSLFQAAGYLLFVAAIFCPLVLFLTNVIERRASFRLLIQQEYSALAGTMFYALTAASLITIIFSTIGKFTGFQEALAVRTLEEFKAQRTQLGPEMFPAVDEQLLNAGLFAAALSLLILFVVFVVWSALALRVTMRLSWLRAVLIVCVSSALVFPASFVLMPIFSRILASPFLLLLLFLLFRGYFSELTRSHRARESFRQNLEAATLNPADSSAHYNLGLIHQQRGEIEAARERFERALQIDEEEIDAHYQLGRIARQQKRFADAVRHFEQVVTRDLAHAQHEVWREAGATYLAAGQYEDARNALERFLENRPSDPEALYLMGRTHAALGHRREAASSMQACIEAVRTAPAYKYRADKRWLNEAQQFLRSQI